ncbi:hypothetical protein B0A48_13741 [Cryoendolithus antarcticus]|uniref:Uncharacterized protein n=1 Tax=Cryoendolithus antarcticus TaxID=1507870 RepID=A0A1V8SND4_9PEZI|nr:hypothetical protein B0A48_13741 [Cryoendolithus antarcticus]
MGPRPANLSLASSTHHPSDNNAPLPPPRFPNFQLDLPSPRAGEVPPALSPLDAFALQSRLLAKKFEDEAQAGRRLSRLPHGDVARTLANRPEYFARSASGGMSDVEEEDGDGQRPMTRGNDEDGNRPVTRGGDDEGRRPKSFYPLLERISMMDVPAVPDLSGHRTFYDASEEQGNLLKQPQVASDYFGAPRAASPEPVDPSMVNIEAPSPQLPSLTSSYDSLQSTSHPRTLTNGSTRSNNGLLPPRSPGFPKSPRSMKSIRSVMQDGGDDDAASARGVQATSELRKFSGSSAKSRPHSPFSHFMRTAQRSPSMTSECSLNDPTQLPRPLFNFSRPLSSHGSRPSLGGARRSIESKRSFDGSRPSGDSASRPPAVTAMSNGSVISSDSGGGASRQSSHDGVLTPYANVPTPSELEHVAGEYFSGVPLPQPEAQANRRFSLPRGRAVQRSSAEQRASWIEKQFSWDDAGNGADRTERETSPTAKPTIRAVTPERSQPSQAAAQSPVPALDQRDTTEDLLPGLPAQNATPPRSNHHPTPSILSQSTDATIRANLPLHTRVPSAELTPDQHLEIGIQAHSSGALQKSTYHLRLAAKAGLPTAMLLYALACRHGWGMRPSQEEGVIWLRKAIASSSLEMADSSDLPAADASPAAAQERRKRKAQFALAIYELGISYMNGWGCSKDKPLAVQCFELAGNWGDADALAEAGYCYTRGVGCRKDLKKAAALYRRAEEGGMSMAGNSWIYKSKYMDSTDSTSARNTPEKDGESKRFENFLAKDMKDVKDIAKAAHEKDGASTGRSRGRSIWGRKKEK